MFCPSLFKPTKNKCLEHLSIFNDISSFTGIDKLRIFIHSVLQNFEKFESFLRLVQMQSITTGKDNLKSIVAMHQLFVVVTLSKNYIKNLRNMGNLNKLLCVTHQEALCVRTSKLIKCNEYNCKRCKYDFA